MQTRLIAAAAIIPGLIAFSTRANDATARQQVSAPDSARLLHDLAVLAHDSMEGRAPGTEGSARARAFLIRELAQAGVTPMGESFEHAFGWARGRSGVNVIGRVAGLGGDGVIVLTAHYDHDGIRNGEIFNGADDNASGTAAVLEIARLAVAEPLSNTLVIALVDAEESGLQGARAFVRDPPLPIETVSLNVNLDMVARSGGLLWASGAHHTPALRPILERVAADAPVTLRLGHDRRNAPEGADWTGSSDHAPFHAVGIPFVYFGVEDHPDYHRSTDDYERVDPGEYINSVRTIAAALRVLDAALPLPTPADGR
jgi:Zn-dependent M28 family amino/carboxypeptidase